MFLHEIFKADKIKLDIEAEDKDQVFDELVSLLVGTEHVGRKDEFLIVIRERENIISTGIKDGIAIPHGKIDNLDRSIGVIGLSKKGIEYGSLDNNPAKIIFMFISNKSKKEEHLAVLKRISKISENANFRKDILLAKTPESANKILKVYEASM
jgi:mannitol/fructose-specific phosphotransferase system IIA component (Ntr-type)